MTDRKATERWETWLPGIARARNFPRAWLRGDLIAGIAVAALLVPHGMAYAELAGVPAVTGLYTTVVALVAYAIFGPSRILMVGPDSSLAPLIAAAIILVGADGDPARAVATAGMLALLTGAISIVAGLGRLGLLAELLSRPVRVGYLNGLAVVMVISQLPKLLGISVDADSTLGTAVDVIEGVADGDTDGTTLAIGVLCLVVILGLGRLSPRAPGVLVAVVGATAVVALFDLADDGVDVVGTIPSGFPELTWPGVPLSDIPTLTAAALGVSLLMLSDTTALSRSFASRDEAEVDPNREMIALGFTNGAAGLFQGFPVSASTSRTTVAAMSGGRSQLVGVVGAALVAVLLIAGGSFIENLPAAALAAVVIAAAAKLFDMTELRWLRAVRPSELLLSLAATVGVITIGVLEGVVVAILLSLGNFVRRVWRPYDAVLARVDGRKGYHDISRHPEARQIPGLLLFRFDAPLFFANADHFVRRLRGAIKSEPIRVRTVVVAAEPMTDIDTTGAEVLNNLLNELEEAEITLAFAELKGPVKDRLARYGLFDRIGERNFHPTLGRAIDAYVDDSGVDWTDWTDER